MTDLAQRKWLERLIPLPKRIEIGRVENVSPREIGLTLPGQRVGLSPVIEKLLRPFAQASTGGRFEIRLALLSDDPGVCSERTREALGTVANKEQAYGVEPIGGGERMTGLLLVAHTPLGLLYAARTLAQLLAAPAEGDEAIEIPAVTILDWPDIAERGQWGGTAGDDLECTSQWKLNVLEATSGPYVDQAGQPRLRMDREYVQEANDLGVKIVPFISHLEQLVRSAGLMDRPDLASTPDPSKPLPGEYVPGLCMSSPATVELVGRWLAQSAELEGVSDLQVWLSEDSSPCFCPKCQGREPYQLEVACILKAFEQAKAVNPNVKLRMGLSQGSYPVNDKILAMVPEGVGVTYYDGGRTYDSSHAPMIYPLLEAYARSGRWLGVYPQITHCWRTVFPWTAPQFIRARAQEFAEKNLQCVIGYAVPSNPHHRFNVMALGEWTWNARGRSPEDFCRAYAQRTGICDADLFARWATKAGDAGWWLAESRLLLTAIYHPEFGLKGPAVSDHRFEMARLLYDRGQIESALASAHEALDLACEADVAGMIDETESVAAGLRALLALDSVSTIFSKPSLNDQDRKILAQVLEELDHSAAILSTRVPRWARRVEDACEPQHKVRSGSRLLDTASVMLRVCDAVRGHASSLGVADSHPEHRLRTLGTWSAEDFHEDRTAQMVFDVTSDVDPNGGPYYVGFSYDRGDYAAHVQRLAVLRRVAGSPAAPIAVSDDEPLYVGRWERWHEVKIVVPRSAGQVSVVLEIILKADAPAKPRQKDWQCSGSIGIRRAWPEDYEYRSKVGCECDHH